MRNTPFNTTEGTLIEAARHGTGSVSRFIGRSRSEDSVCNSTATNNANKGSASRSNSAESEGPTASPTDSNPSMDKPDVNNAPTTKSSSSAKYKAKEHHTHLYGSRCRLLFLIIYYFHFHFDVWICLECKTEAKDIHKYISMFAVGVFWNVFHVNLNIC